MYIMSKKYRPHEFAEKIAVSVKTLQRWDASGKLIAKRTPSNHRYYDDSDLRQLYGLKEEDRKIVVYCRVSSSGQKDDLKSQVKAMEQFCLSSGITVDLIPTRNWWRNEFQTQEILIINVSYSKWRNRFTINST